jgi:hypothetical protein
MFGRNRRELVSDDSGWLHILRESACPGPREVRLQIDGMDVAKLTRGKSKSVRLAPGEHRIHLRSSAGNWSSWVPLEETLRFAPGEELEFTICCVAGGFIKKPLIAMQRRLWRDQIRHGKQPVARQGVDWSRHSFQVFETGLVQEPAGQTSFVEDNTGSSVSSSRITRVENEWTRTIVIGGGSTTTNGISAQLNVGWVSVEAKTENAVTSQYSIEQGERRQVSQEVQLHVPAWSRVDVRVSWKLVWQTGFVRITDPNGAITDVPFRFVHSMDFDRYSVST